MQFTRAPGKVLSGALVGGEYKKITLILSLLFHFVSFSV